MKVLALRRSVAQVYADTQVYTHDDTKDDYENAFLISNLTTHNILYLNYSIKTLEILNKSGIAAVEIQSLEELFTLIRCNFTYDYEDNIIYLHDYSYYTNNEIRTDQYWVTKTDIEEYLLPGWKLTYVGYNGSDTRGHYNFSFTCQNAATDDDLIIEYIYSEVLDFQNFMLKKIKERMTTSLPIARLSNRVFRDKLFPLLSKKRQRILNIGPRNESMFTFLNFPSIKQFSNGPYLVKDTIKLKQERWLGKRVSQFDIGQYKNMMNVITTVYYYYNLYQKKPTIYMVGSAPSYWIYDVKQYSDFTFETWDPFDTPYSSTHHKELFSEKDIAKLKDDSILYIDIRTDRGNIDWKEWRKIVEAQTVSNLKLAYQYLASGKSKVCCVKMTAMDLELPISAKLLHHPTTEIRSEFYLLLDIWDISNVKRFIPKGVLYSFINNVITENVFIQPPFKIKTFKNDYIVALYALSNDFNDRIDVINLINNQKQSLITVRINNTFKDEPKVGFKNIYDWTFLPTDFNTTDTIITSYDGCLGIFGLSISLASKPTGNNHLFILNGTDKYYKLDQFANHTGISRRSHQIRFSESATSYSGYIFRDLSNNNFNLIGTNIENSVSGHVYNALIYYRYNYSFDLKRWIYLHSIEKADIEGGKYYEHAPIELIYACKSAKEFASLQDDLTVLRYANEIERYINKVYSITYADDPNYFIGIKFRHIPYKYDVKVPHLTFGVLFISDSMIPDVVKIMKNMRNELFGMDVTTSYTYMLSDGVYVANVSGVLATYFKMYNLFYKSQITFGQSRMFIPHITLSFNNNRTVRIETTKLKINSIYLRKIKGDTVFDMSE
ncbi:VP3 [Human rotavirus A]|uniref:Protein VP3 n=1 Tax=Human rotavirus A TaxID=10941 RepID=A0A0B4ZTI9_9REOV|nr:VP3 [Human rotavirus A]AJD79831.1 VP3 [Human rotavirus A]AJD79842.1 VP3 [Human rotavirus A]AJD79875.1 VP3 [Human rotavirus A]AJD79887.1 VP3 [Human rotavirus A]